MSPKEYNNREELKEGYSTEKQHMRCQHKQVINRDKYKQIKWWKLIFSEQEVKCSFMLSTKLPGGISRDVHQVYISQKLAGINILE